MRGTAVEDTEVVVEDAGPQAPLLSEVALGYVMAVPAEKELPLSSSIDPDSGCCSVCSWCLSPIDPSDLPSPFVV